jgi:hypothetical protein
VSPVTYELGFYTPEDGILLGHFRGNLKSYIFLYVVIYLIEPVYSAPGEYMTRFSAVLLHSSLQLIT